MTFHGKPPAEGSSVAPGDVLRPVSEEPVRQSRLGTLVWLARAALPFTAYPYVGSHGACPACRETRTTPVSSFDRRWKHLLTVACDGCGLLRTDPLPTEAELETYYTRLYRVDYQFALFGPRRRHVEKRRREAEQRAAVLEGLLPLRARTLDFGAGSGEFVTLMAERGHDAYGFDPGASYVDHATDRLGGRIRRARWQEIDSREDFDLVTSFHVFEHLRDPVPAFRAVARWLKPGGLVYVEVPNALRQLEKRGLGSLHFAHVIGFNRYNLEYAAARAGLEAVKVVSQTHIVFRKTGVIGSLADLATRGADLTRYSLKHGSLCRAYLRHHARKIGRMARPAA